MPEFNINPQSVINQLQAKLSEATLENAQLVSIIEELNKNNEALAAQLSADDGSTEGPPTGEVAGNSAG